MSGHPGQSACLLNCVWSAVLLQTYVEREEGNCEVEYVACGSGLERIYRFLQSDESCNRPTVDLENKQVLRWRSHALSAPAYASLRWCDTAGASAGEQRLLNRQFSSAREGAAYAGSRMRLRLLRLRWMGAIPWRWRQWIYSWPSLALRRATWGSER